MATPKNMIIFGETGAGKSSLVNMATGREDAKTGNDATGVTFESGKHSAELYGSEYQIFDTIGLNEGDEGSVKGKDAIINLFQLVKGLENGVSLLIFCMRGRIKKTTADNYQLFHKIFCDSKVPIILVVTGLEELEEEELATWWVRNRKAFQAYGMEFNGWVCGTTTKGKKGVYTEEFNVTQKKLRYLIHDLVLENAWRKPRATWFTGIVKLLARAWPGAFGKMSWTFGTLYNALLSVGGLPKDEAKELAAQAME